MMAEIRSRSLSKDFLANDTGFARCGLVNIDRNWPECKKIH
jgi:hypothetical protein